VRKRDAAKRRWWARNERLSGGPGYFRAILDLYLHSDVRPGLESIQAPTLHARLLELDGDDNIWFAGDADRVLDEIESFLTGGRRAAPSNRVLSTVLFTDIVGSTQRAAQLGDDAWTVALADHNRLVERQVRAGVVS
jgi:class 3 adenylate cyclase